MSLQFKIIGYCGFIIFGILLINELNFVEGGVNYWGVASGVLTCVGAGLGIAASVLDPEPVSKTLGLYSSISYFGAGVAAIGWALT